MRRLLLIPAALTAGALVPGTASAEIVKAPTGERSQLTVNSATLKTIKRHKLKLAATGAAKKSGSAKLTMPYSLSRWDFSTREGDVAHFAKHTGFRLRRGSRSARVVHPRLVLDSPTSGYVTMLISNERIKFFTVSGTRAKATDSPNLQQIAGLRLKLTQAGANYVNRALKRKALRRFSQFGTLDLRLIKPPTSTGPAIHGAAPGGESGGGSAPGQGDNPGGTVTVAPGFLETLPGGGALTPIAPGGSIDSDGDGEPEGGMAALPLEDVEFDLDTNTGTIDLGGGLIITAPGLEVSLVNPQVVIGATSDASGLFAEINGVRVKIGDIDTRTLNLDIGEGTVRLHDLDVTVSGALAPLLNAVLGSPVIQAGTPLLSLDLSFPRL